jgi:indole-3-glycerol phosphate synthase
VATHTAPILERILRFRRTAIDELKQRQSERAVAAALGNAPVPRDFAGALVRTGVALIAECKERSPSGGMLQVTYDPIAIAERYAANGAAAISVLTEPEFFGGSLLHLKEVRARVNLPVLCKDFVIDPIQVRTARAAGADALLLIVSILEDGQLRLLYRVTRELGMAALVEVHNARELRRALRLEEALIGINNRDLTSMTTDRGTTARLRPLIPPERIVVSESGISTRADVEELRQLGVNAVLVGEALLRAQDLAAKVRELSEG